jgi:hypothetical protein
MAAEVSISHPPARRLVESRPKGGHVQYMALIYGDETRWAALSEEDQDEIRGRYRALAADAQKAGVMAGGDELGSTRDATTVRVRGDETLVTDGPYAELKEALGGYFLFECDTLDEALDWAARIPAAEHGAVEVRPVFVDPAEPQL